MTKESQRAQLNNEFEAIINRYALECDLTLCDYLGVLELLKYNLLIDTLPKKTHTEQ